MSELVRRNCCHCCKPVWVPRWYTRAPSCETCYSPGAGESTLKANLARRGLSGVGRHNTEQVNPCEDDNTRCREL